MPSTGIQDIYSPQKEILVKSMDDTEDRHITTIEPTFFADASQQSFSYQKSSPSSVAPVISQQPSSLALAPPGTVAHR